MLDNNEDPRRVDVWMAMADHFLDTETRQDIPRTALKCVEAGLSVREARDIWRYEVSPAVGYNLWVVAGEWGAWGREWLVRRIGRNRIAPKVRGIVARALSLPLYLPSRGMLESVERCLHALLAIESEPEREQIVKVATFLGHHYFDFLPKEICTLRAGGYERIRALYPEPFCSWMAPATSRDEINAANARVEAALERGRPR
jgi:hypothetical protein